MSLIRPRPLLRKVGIGAAIGIGAIWGVGVVTQMSTIVAKKLRVKRARQQGFACAVCIGTGKTDCQACLTAGYLDFSSKLDDPFAVIGLCPICKGEGLQRCCNCLGEGVDLTSVTKSN